MQAQTLSVTENEISRQEVDTWTLSDLVQNAQQHETAGDLSLAQALYARWVSDESKPNRHYALFNQAVLLSALGKLHDALTVYETCIQVAPGFAQAYINGGLTHEKLGQNRDAISVWSDLIARVAAGDPIAKDMQVTALNHIGRVQESLRLYAQAEAALAQSLNLDPDQPGVIQHWVHIRQKGCQWPVHEPLRTVSEGELWRATSPLAMLALTDRPEQSLVTAQSFVARTYGVTQQTGRKGHAYRHDKVRVGYVSGDLREHAVGFLLPTVMQSHDRTRYDIYAYDFSQDDGSDLRRNLLSEFNEVRNIRHLTDSQAAQLIMHDEIDVLIDLHGLSAGARPGIFALRPAPHQGTYLGFIGPCGMPWLDFVIADEKVLPPDLALHFSEKPLYVQGSFLPWTADQRTAPPAMRADFDLPDDAFVMGAFGNVYKITPEMFASWMRLLERIPESILMLLDDNPLTTRQLQSHAQAYGADMSRIRFVPRTSHASFGANLRLLDTYLDTYPYNCGSTSIDVIRAGVPLVSRYGATMVSRMGLSVLSALDAADNAVPDLQAYEDRVVALYLRARAGKPYTYKRQQPTLNINHALDQLGVATTKDQRLGFGAVPAQRACRIEIRHLAYDEETFTAVPEGFIGLDNRENAAPDWREYWPIRNHLLENDLDEDTLYGFFSPRFKEKSGLSFDAIKRFVNEHGKGCDVVGFSPYWDFNALFQSPFHQGEFFHAGLMDAMQTAADLGGVGLRLDEVVMHSENTIYCNYFVASKRFWLAWLELGERYYRYATALEQEADALVNKAVNHRGGQLPMKIFVQERLVNLLLATGAYRSKTYDIFALSPSATPLNQFFDQAVTGNALKLSHQVTGEVRYLEQYQSLMASVFPSAS